MSLTEEQQKIRANGVGSSEIAMLVTDEDGQPLSPFGGRHTLWRRKTGQELDENEPSGDILERGTAYEPVIAGLWARKEGFELVKPDTIRHPLYSYCVDSCDFIARKDGKPIACVETKAPIASSYYKWADGPPIENLPQCQWHMGHHKLDKCWLVYDCGYGVGAYQIDYDEEMWLALVSMAETFWQDFVDTGCEPPADGDAETSRWLARRCKRKLSDMDAADDDAIELMTRLRDATLEAKAAKATMETLENEMKQAIGDTEGLYVRDSGWRVTYKTRKGKKTLDKKALAAEVGTDKVEKHTKDGKPSRQLDKKALVNQER